MGFIADLIVKIVMSIVWEETTESYKEASPNEKVPFWLDNEKRMSFNWAPRLIGIIERVFYTTAVIFNQFIFIGVWVAFKVIGNWSDFSLMRKVNLNKKEELGETRIRANNFLIGSGLSLILGILGGIIFRLTLDQNFLIELIQKSYPNN